MSKKFSQRRREAFLRAVRGSGNQTLAAERARVSRSWVTATRAKEPAFDRAVRDAVAAFDPRATGSCEPAVGWRGHDGARLVVRGTNGRRVQVARARVREFCPATEARFLAALRATCNVKEACAAAGVGYGAAYAHRKRWPGFARRWDQALEEGYVRLEFALLLNARNSLSPPDEREEAEVEMPPMSAWGALQLLKLHQHRVRGTGKPLRQARALPSIEQVRAEVLAKLSAIDRMEALDGREAVARALREAG